MAANFPNSPTNGQQFTVGSTTWQWDSTAALWTIVKPLVMPDAANDSKDYVRNNNGWKTVGKTETIVPGASTTVAVPSWARRVRIIGKLSQTSGTAQYMLLRLQFGATVLQTAGDYYLAGRVHNCNNNTITPYYNNATFAGMMLSYVSSTTNVNIHFDHTLDLSVPNTSRNYMISGKAMHFGSNEPWLADWYNWVVPGKTSALRVDNLIFVNGGGAIAWDTSSTIDLEWLA